MKQRYTNIKFQAKTLAVIKQANDIHDEFVAQSFTMTLRQLYYQFVARGFLTENTLAAYKRIGSIINDARLAGLVDWDAIEDRTRSLIRQASWDNQAARDDEEHE